LRSFRAEARRAGAEVLPLWLATDHLACTLGSLNKYGPRIVLLDTGGIGIGLVTTKQFARLSGIEVDYANPIPGGFFTFIADKISLGDAVRRDVPGLIGPPILDQFTFEVIGGFTHEFYKPFAVTFDFVDMNPLHHGRSAITTRRTAPDQHQYGRAVVSVVARGSGSGSPSLPERP
jgi:hypothetical protein